MPSAPFLRPWRKRVHLACFAVFLALPFTNLLRLDIPAQRVYLAGVELWISEFSILFFATMFAMFLVAASAVLYGRVYCGWLCPQMIFSEAAQALQAWTKGVVTRVAPGLSTRAKALAAGALFHPLLALGSMVLAFIFTSYFVAPRDLLGRLLRFDLVTVGGITGATVTLLTYLDLAFVRQSFCVSVCPYGTLQGLLQDRQTLQVAYADPGEVCIDCGKCVKACFMGIDIRKGPDQIECVACGDCVDACEDVLPKLGHRGLIGYAWGGRSGGGEPWWRRMGLRDGKRVVLALVLTAYAVGLGVALRLRTPVLLRAVPERTTLWRRGADGQIANRVRLTFANRSPRAVTVAAWVEGLPGARLDLAPNPVPLAPGGTFEATVDLWAPLGPSAPELVPIRVLAQSSDRPRPQVLEMNFIGPAPKE